MAGEETSLSLILSCCHNKSVLSCFSFSLFRTFLFWVGGHSSDETKCNGEAKLVIKQNNAPSHSFSRIYLCPFETEFWIYLCPNWIQKKIPLNSLFPPSRLWAGKREEVEFKRKKKVNVAALLRQYILLCAQTSDARFISARSYLSVPSTAFASLSQPFYHPASHSHWGG